MFNTAFQISRGPERHVPKLSIAYKLLDVHVHALTQNICTEKNGGFGPIIRNRTYNESYQNEQKRSAFGTCKFAY